MIMKSVIVTGATSMIGVALINECVKKNINVLAIVRPNSKNINRLTKNSRLQILECEIGKLNEVMKYVKERYDVFYHLAWEGTNKVDRYNPEVQEDNIKNTLLALKVAKSVGCTRFIGAGSQAEYGVNDEVINENTRANPSTAYGIAKYCAFMLGEILARNLGIDFVWGRVFSVYGEFDNEGTVINYCIDKLLNNESPQLSNCEQMWDYLYSEDVGLAFYLLGISNLKENLYCIANGKSIKLIKYMNIIRDEINPKLHLGVGEVKSNTKLVSLNTDISRLVRDTGFIPRYTFEEGIKRIIKYKLKNN